MLKMEPPIRLYKRPRLKNPYLIVGWADAGLVGIEAIDYLIDKLDAEEFGEIEPHYFSFLPHSIIKGGVLQEIEYPRNTFYYWKNKKSTNDLIISGSRPPAINHYQFANLILDVAEYFKVNRIYTVGGIQAHIAHTEKPRVSAVVNNPGLKKYVMHYNISLGMNYHGPTSMNGLILGIAKQRNIEGISLWGRIADYIGEIPNPQVCEAVLRVLTRMLDIDIDFSQIRNEARHANTQIDELVTYIRQQDPRLDRHIGRLEKGMNVEVSAEDKQRFFEEIEEYLKQQKGRSENDSA